MNFMSLIPIVGSMLGAFTGSKGQKAAASSTESLEPWGPSQPYLKQLMEMAMALNKQNLYPEAKDMVASLSPLQKFVSEEAIGTLYDPTANRLAKNALFNLMQGQAVPASNFFAEILAGRNPVGKGLFATGQSSQQSNLLQANPYLTPTKEESDKISTLKEQVRQYIADSEAALAAKTQQNSNTGTQEANAANTLQQLIQALTGEQEALESRRRYNAMIGPVDFSVGG